MSGRCALGAMGGARRLAAFGIALALAFDLAIGVPWTGVPCASCGGLAGRGPLALAGLVGWTLLGALERRMSAAVNAVAVGLFAGVHFALASYLVAIPRWCTVCVISFGLAGIAFGTVLGAPRERWLAVPALAAAAAATHLLLVTTR